MIELKGLKKNYSERTVIDIDNLSFAEGETICLAGPNGCGKTTLLKILAGIIKSDSGYINMPGKVLYMPQKPYAFKGSLIKNITVADKKADAVSLLEKAELLSMKDKSASSLSGGELQKLSLCRLLAIKADVLLLDEPTSACDPHSAELVMNMIKEYRAENSCTVIMSTHSPAVALNNCDRLILLNNGRIEADDSPDEICAGKGNNWARSFIDGWKIQC